MKFETPKENDSIIKVLGVGGGGSNAVNHMYRQGIKGVDFIICNTDQQSLDNSPVPTKIQIGSSLTQGRGAGAIAEVGKNAAIENIEEIKAALGEHTKMVFITAGMGGGTGTGAAPILAATAKEQGILTVGIVTIPFSFEGKKRKAQAEKGIEEMREAVDTLIIICNDRIREMYGNLSISNAFSHADEVLSTAAKGIAEIITSTGVINVDFEDVRTVMSDSGVAIMGSALSTGENRASHAIEEAISSPLLNDNNIQGANYVLLNITYGTDEIQMDEIVEITDYIQKEAGEAADIIWGHGHDESLGANIRVTLIATGFNQSIEMGYHKAKQPEKKVINLDDVQKEINKPSYSDQSTFPKQSTQSDQSPQEPFIKRTIHPTSEENSQTEPRLTSVNDSFKQEENDYLKNQRVIEFEIDKEDLSNQTPANNDLEPTLVETSQSAKKSSDQITKKITTEAEKQSKIKERLERLKDLSSKLKAPSGLAELEAEPAYKRREISLDDQPSSQESQNSRYTLTEENDPIHQGEKKYSIKENNSFLHDNVD